MKFNIVSEKENPMMKRRELNVSIEHGSAATPSKATVQQHLAKELSKELEFIEVKDIFSDNGESGSKARVFVWEDKKAPDYSKVVKVKKEKAPKTPKPKKTK
jgi:ribosomal protein S24E